MALLLSADLLPAGDYVAALSGVDAGGRSHEVAAYVFRVRRHVTSPPMADKVRWGVLGVAAIAVRKVIPAMRGATAAGSWPSPPATRPRPGRRRGALGIPRAYGSYEELLADPEVDAVYNPLPNHLHVPWTVRAAEAGKHVLCEKPIGLTAEEARGALAARDRTGVDIQEAFMVRTHPQWLAARELVRSGRIGALRAVVGCFSYFNEDPANVRNVAAYGGGALMDIGCYPITVSRFLFGEEPPRGAGARGAGPAVRHRPPDLGAPRLPLRPRGLHVQHAAGAVPDASRCWAPGAGSRWRSRSTRPPTVPAAIFVDDGSDVSGAGVETSAFDTCDQYAIQADLFSRSILEGARRGRPPGGLALEHAGDPGRVPVRRVGRVGGALRPVGRRQPPATATRLRPSRLAR